MISILLVLLGDFRDQYDDDTNEHEVVDSKEQLVIVFLKINLGQTKRAESFLCEKQLLLHRSSYITKVV